MNGPRPRSRPAGRAGWRAAPRATLATRWAWPRCRLGGVGGARGKGQARASEGQTHIGLARWPASLTGQTEKQAPRSKRGAAIPQRRLFGGFQGSGRCRWCESPKPKAKVFGISTQLLSDLAQRLRAVGVELEPVDAGAAHGFGRQRLPAQGGAQAHAQAQAQAQANAGQLSRQRLPAQGAHFPTRTYPLAAARRQGHVRGAQLARCNKGACRLSTP